MVFKSRYFVFFAVNMDAIDSFVREVVDIYEAWVKTLNSSPCVVNEVTVELCIEQFSQKIVFSFDSSADF